MFVSNSNEDIKIELSSLEDGWKVKGSNVKVQMENSKDAFSQAKLMIDNVVYDG